MSLIPKAQERNNSLQKEKKKKSHVIINTKMPGNSTTKCLLNSTTAETLSRETGNTLERRPKNEHKPVGLSGGWP